MARQKKSRKISDIMPARKADKKTERPLSGKKLSRYELDAKAREEKKKRKHKGLDSGSRHSAADIKKASAQNEAKDPRIGSRKKVPLVVEFVNKPEKGQFIQPVKVEAEATPKKLDPYIELQELENNECLNQLLDDLEAGKTLAKQDQQFVDECLARIEQLMDELGIVDEDEQDKAEDLLRTFQHIDINQFK